MICGRKKGILGCHSSRPWAGRPGVSERTFAYSRVNKRFISHADIINADIINADIINVSYRMDCAKVPDRNSASAELVDSSSVLVAKKARIPFGIRRCVHDASVSLGSGGSSESRLGSASSGMLPATLHGACRRRGVVAVVSACRVPVASEGGRAGRGGRCVMLFRGSGPGPARRRGVPGPPPVAGFRQGGQMKKNKSGARRRVDSGSFLSFVSGPPMLYRAVRIAGGARFGCGYIPSHAAACY